MNMVIFFVVASAVILIVSGILFGLVRGSRKAFLRLTVVFAVALICLFITPAVTKSVLRMEFVENLAFGGESYEEFVAGFVDNQLEDDSFFKEFFEYAQADYAELIQSVPLMLANLIMFFVLSMLLWLIGFVVYWILVAIFARDPKIIGENGERVKPNKRRWLGALLGAISGLIIFVMTMTPLCGIISIAAKAQDIKVDGKYIMEDSYLGVKIDFKEYVDSPMGKMLSIFGLTNKLFDNLTTIEYDGRKIVLSEELDMIFNLIGEFDELDTQDGSLASLLENPEKLKRIVSTLLGSEIVSSVCNKFLDFLVDNPKSFLEEKDEIYADLISSTAQILRTDFAGEINNIIDFASVVFSNLKTAEDGSIELSKFLSDTTALKNIIEAMHESECIKNIVNLAMNFIADNLQTLAGENEMVKENIESFSKLFRTLAVSSKEEMIKTIESFGVISSFGFLDGSTSLASLKDEDIDTLVDALFGSETMRDIVVTLVPALMGSFLEELGLDVSSQISNVTDWEKEKEAFKVILSNIGLLSELMGIETETTVKPMSFAATVSDKTDNGVKDIFTKENARAFGDLFNAFRDSQILKPFYNGLIKWDDAKKEYYVVNKFNQLINSNGENAMSISKAFRQKGAVIQNPQTPNKNIDWDLFNWSMLFDSIFDGIQLFASLELLQKNVIGEENNVDEICELIGSLDNEEKSETIQTIIDTMLPPNVNITLPDLTTVSDFQKEAEIFRNIASLKDKEFTQNQVNQIISQLSESELILPVLESFNGIIPISDQAKSMIEISLMTQNISFALKVKLEAIFGLGK